MRDTGMRCLKRWYGQIQTRNLNSLYFNFQICVNAIFIVRTDIKRGREEDHAFTVSHEICPKWCHALYYFAYLTLNDMGIIGRQLVFVKRNCLTLNFTLCRNASFKIYTVHYWWLCYILEFQYLESFLVYLAFYTEWSGSLYQQILHHWESSLATKCSFRHQGIQ